MVPSNDPRRLLRGLSLPVLLLFGSLTTGCRFGSSTDPHMIGQGGPVSGADQATGLRLEIAVRLVVEDFNHDEANRIEKRPITIVHGDSGPDLDGFTFQATRLLAVNRVSAMIGGTDGFQLENLVSPVQSARVVLVRPSGGPATPVG